MLDVWQQQIGCLNRLLRCRLICRRLQERNFTVRRGYSKRVGADKLVPSPSPTAFRRPINFGIPRKNMHQYCKDRDNRRSLMSSHSRQVDKLTTGGSGHESKEATTPLPSREGDREDAISDRVRHRNHPCTGSRSLLRLAAADACWLADTIAVRTAGGRENSREPAAVSCGAAVPHRRPRAATETHPTFVSAASARLGAVAVAVRSSFRLAGYSGRPPRPRLAAPAGPRLRLFLRRRRGVAPRPNSSPATRPGASLPASPSCRNCCARGVRHRSLPAAFLGPARGIIHAGQS